MLKRNDLQKEVTPPFFAYLASDILRQPPFIYPPTTSR